MNFGHDGKYGDLIASLALAKAMGGGSLRLLPTNPVRHDRFTEESIQPILPLLAQQSYLTDIAFAQRLPSHALDLGKWRNHHRHGLNLVDMYFSWLGKPHPDRHLPWLQVEPAPHARVVFARSARYHGSFPWKRALRKYHGQCAFLGLPEEHKAFQQQLGDIPYLPTADLLEAARIIAGSQLVCVNQTGLYWIAEGLKRPVCLEAAGDHGTRNAHWNRLGFFYSESEYAELPDLEVLDELSAELATKTAAAESRFQASVHANRDEGRSLLSEDRREQLALAAMSCADLLGDVAEVGVYRGGSAAIIASALPGKWFFLFDTFAGHPHDDGAPGAHKQGEFAVGICDVGSFLRKNSPNLFRHPNGSDYAVFVEGIFPESTQKFCCVNEQQFCFVHLDADLYQTTKDALDFFWPRMVPGGKIVLDDWQSPDCPGIAKAVEDAGLAGRIQVTTKLQAVLRK